MTGRWVIAGVWLCASITMVASAHNASIAFAALGLDARWGFAIGVAVDIGLAVALIGDYALHQAGVTVAWGRRLRITTMMMSGALNCGIWLWNGRYGVAVFHAFLPVLLVVLTEAAQSYALAFRALADARDLAARQAGDLAARQERELVASLASILAIGACASTTPAWRASTTPAWRASTTPAWRASITPAPRQPGAPAPDRSDELATLVERARPLLAATPGMGRTTLARQLDVSTHRARQVLMALDDERTIKAVA